MAKNTLFKIKDIDTSIPIENTHYFNWLNSQNLLDIHSIETKKAYLKSIGFEIGKDRISSKAIDTLRYIEQYYFRKTLNNTKK
jgi:hypothetical protein